MAEKTHEEVHVLSGVNGKAFQRRLEGKVVVVTGGARGIGEATVKLFAKHGAKVIIADVNDEEGHRLAESLGPSVTYIHCNVSQEPEIEHLVDSTISQHGKLDIFFNNAGLFGSPIMRITEFDAEEFDHLMRVNVRGAAIGMKHAARVMIPQKSGCIISTSSVSGIMGGQGPHSYSATKHAIVGLTKNVACELGVYGIRVNCISPFGVATSMVVNALKGKGFTGSVTPSEEEVQVVEELVRSQANLKGPTLKTQDIAEAALYLASDESRYVSGHNLVVDGGVTAGRTQI